MCVMTYIILCWFHDRLAKNVFRALKPIVLLNFSSKDAERENICRSPSNENILGNCYERQTRMRQPIKTHPIQPRDGCLFAIYSNLQCPDIAETPEVHCMCMCSNTKLMSPQHTIHFISRGSQTKSRSFVHLASCCIACVFTIYSIIILCSDIA